MPVIVNTEYGNVNAGRLYPFADGATLLDGDGAALPYDFILDACIYPIGDVGALYLSALDTSAGTLTLSSIETGAAVAVATLTPGTRQAQVYEADGLERMIGVMVFGDGADAVLGGRLVRDFARDATPLAAGVCVPVVQAGVRGILLPDGTLVTGDVTIEGQDGVLVTSRVTEGGNMLRFDVIGLTPPPPEDCNETMTPPLCKLVVEQSAGSGIVISRYGDALALTLKDVSLDEICAAAKANLRPIEGSACDPAPPAPEPEPGTAEELTFNLCSDGDGVFTITAPSSPTYRNPISVRTLVAAAAPSRLDMAPGISIDEAEAAADSFRTPPGLAGTVVIRLNGLGRNKLP